MNIKILDLSEFTKWDSYVMSHPQSSIYHLSKWKVLIENQFSHSTYYIYAVDSDNNITGVLPLIRLKSFLFGDFIVSLPYFNYGGALADDTTISQALMQYASDLCDTIGSNYVEFRDIESVEGPYQCRTDKVSMELTLPPSHEDLWKAFKPKLRAQIRKPTKQGALSKIGRDELLDDFYKVFSENMRDLGTPVYSKSFFKSILSTFPDTTLIAIVEFDGIPVAAGFLIAHNDKLEIPWASSLKRYNSLGVNMLLYWSVLEEAINMGYKIFDFGRSTIDCGTYRFKKQWGAQPKQLYWNYYLKGNCSLPNLTPNNPKYKLAINIWRKLPVSITNIIGPNLVKFLP